MPLVPREIAEVVEIVEEIDAPEPLRWRVSEGLLGGSAGAGWEDRFRGGKAGGGAFFSPVWVIAGGGRTPFCLMTLGSFPMPLLM